MKAIETRISSVYLRTDGVLYVAIKDHEVITRKDTEELMLAVYKIGKGKKFKNLIVLGEYTIADIEALKLASSEAGSIYTHVDAFVIKSMAQKIIANFYMKVIKPVCPTRFFTELEDAEKWLAEIDVEKEVVTSQGL